MPTGPTTGWADLRGRAVGVWGLGVEGLASVRRLRAMGVEPVLVDDRAELPGALGSEGPGAEVLRTDDGGIEALGRCEVVLKTPGISRYRPEVTRLEEDGVVVTGGLALWMAEAERDRVLCVTGTKGKSTTAAIAGHLLGRWGRRCLVAGNIGRPPYDPEVGDAYDFWVIEVSSFQAADLTSAPPVVAVTSLHADHLDWHGDAARYYRDKLSICTRPGARLTVADGTSDELRRHRHLLGSEVRWVAENDPGLDGDWVDRLGLVGGHNRRNALVARASLAAMGVPEATEGTGEEGAAVLARAAEGFDGLESRLQPIGTVDGVTFVDDSLSTNVLPTLAALAAFAGRRVALIVGGFDRGIDYRPLAEGLLGRDDRTLVLTLPASGPRIHAEIDAVAGALSARPGGRRELRVIDHADLGEATRDGFGWAGRGGVVLLSPAAPSFGQFRDYRERSEVFAEAMRTCGAPS